MLKLFYVALLTLGLAIGAVGQTCPDFKGVGFTVPQQNKLCAAHAAALAKDINIAAGHFNSSETPGKGSSPFTLDLDALKLVPFRFIMVIGGRGVFVGNVVVISQDAASLPFNMPTLPGGANPCTLRLNSDSSGHRVDASTACTGTEWAVIQ